MDIAQGANVQWFRAVDRDGSGRIDARELQQALAMGQLHFSLQTVAAMIRLHDSDRSGTISMEEFSNLHSFILQMQSAFQQFDTDRSGALTRDEVFRSLQQAGFKLDQHAFEMMFSAYDPDRSNSLGLAEFMGMTVFLKHASAIFTAFDPQRSGRITLDFFQFVYAASNCR